MSKVSKALGLDKHPKLRHTIDHILRAAVQIPLGQLEQVFLTVAAEHGIPAETAREVWDEVLQREGLQ